MFTYHATGKEVPADELPNVPLLLLTDEVHGGHMLALDGEDQLRDFAAARSELADLGQFLENLQGERRDAVADPERYAAAAAEKQSQLEQAFLTEADRLGVEPTPDSIPTVVTRGKLGDPLTLFAGPGLSGAWNTLWWSNPGLGPDWANRAVSVRKFPGPFDPLPIASVHSLPFYNGRWAVIVGLIDVELVDLGMSHSVVSVYLV